MSNLLKSKFFLGGLIAVALLVVGSTASAAYMHTTLLKMGQSSSQVMSLQQTLNSGGFLVSTTGAGSPGMESMYFGAKTKAAVMAFQAAKGLAVDGVVGAQSGAALAAMTGGSVSYPAGCSSTTGFSTTTGMSCASTGNSTLPAGCTSTAGYSSTTGTKCDSTGSTPTTGGPLMGGAGSVDSYNLVSGIGNEEVGENAEDIEVAGLEIEVGDGSDLEFTAVRLVFNEGSANEDFEDYATEVSIWLDGKEVGRTDADKFNDDNNWTATISLDGAVIKSDDTGELTVGVSAVSNLDTGDIGETWTVDFTQVRFADADDALISEDPTVAVTTFSFESFAASADTEFKITAGEDEDTVNEGHVINIHATDETDGVEILSFNVEIEGDADVNLDSLPVTITVANQDNVDEMISGMTLWMDGEEVGNATMSDCLTDGDCAAVGTTEDFLFDDLDLDLEAGNEYEFMVTVDIYGITDTGDVAAGDTILARVGEVETDLASFDAEDETGEDLADADITGTVTGEASEVRDIGFNLSFVSSDADVEVGEIAILSDVGTFEIVFDVTPFDGNIFVDSTAPDLTGGATESDLAQTNASGTLACVINGVSGYSTETNSYKVDEDDTGRFKISCDVRDGATDLVDGFTDISIGSILYALTDVDGDLVYNFNLTDFKTSQVYLDDQGF